MISGDGQTVFYLTSYDIRKANTSSGTSTGNYLQYTTNGGPAWNEGRQIAYRMIYDTVQAINTTSMTKIWSFDLDAAQPYARPNGYAVLAKDGTRLMMISTANIWCFDVTVSSYTNASVVWQKRINSGWSSPSPVAASDNSYAVFCPSYESNCYGMDIDRGTVYFTLRRTLTMALSQDNNILYGTDILRNRLSAWRVRNSNGTVRSDPTLLWEYPIPGSCGVDSPPVVSPDGKTVYQTAGDGKCYAVNAQTGQTVWIFATQGPIDGPVVATSDGKMVVIASSDTSVYAVHADTGKQKWRFDTGCTLLTGPSIGPDGRIYFGTAARRFYALSEKCPVLDNCLTALPQCDQNLTCLTCATGYYNSPDFPLCAPCPIACDAGQTAVCTSPFDARCVGTASPGPAWQIGGNAQRTGYPLVTARRQSQRYQVAQLVHQTAARGQVIALTNFADENTLLNVIDRSVVNRTLSDLNAELYPYEQPVANTTGFATFSEAQTCANSSMLLVRSRDGILGLSFDTAASQWMLRWRYALNTTDEPFRVYWVVSHSKDRVIIVGQYRTFALSCATGAEQPVSYDRFNSTSMFLPSFPTLNVAENVVYTARQGNLTAFSIPEPGSNATSGTLLWSYQALTILSASVCRSNNMLFVSVRQNSSVNYALQAINPTTGAVVWSSSTTYDMPSQFVALSPDCWRIYVTGGSTVYAFDNNRRGLLLWTFQMLERPSYPPVLSADGKTLYVHSNDFFLYAIWTADGSLKWSESMRGTPGIYTQVLNSGVILVQGLSSTWVINGYKEVCPTPANCKLEAPYCNNARDLEFCYPRACVDGYHNNLYSVSRCVQCPAPSFCKQSTAASCQVDGSMPTCLTGSCLLGYYNMNASALASVCTACPPASFCKTTALSCSVSGTNSQCPMGACQDGWYNELANSTNSNVTSVGGAICLACPRPANCRSLTAVRCGPSGQSAECVRNQCDAGYFNTAQSGICQQCPRSPNCLSTTSPSCALDGSQSTCPAGQCQTGYYSTAPASQCLRCPAPTNCKADAVSCNSTTGATPLCPLGACQDGWYNEDGSSQQPNGGGAVCVRCPAPANCNATMATRCAAGGRSAECPLGSCSAGYNNSAASGVCVLVQSQSVTPQISSSSSLSAGSIAGIVCGCVGAVVVFGLAFLYRREIADIFSKRNLISYDFIFKAAQVLATNVMWRALGMGLNIQSFVELSERASKRQHGLLVPHAVMLSFACVAFIVSVVFAVSSVIRILHAARAAHAQQQGAGAMNTDDKLSAEQEAMHQTPTATTTVRESAIDLIPSALVLLLSDIPLLVINCRLVFQDVVKAADSESNTKISPIAVLSIVYNAFSVGGSRSVFHDMYKLSEASIQRYASTATAGKQAGELPAATAPMGAGATNLPANVELASVSPAVPAALPAAATAASTSPAAEHMVRAFSMPDSHQLSSEPQAVDPHFIITDDRANV